MERKNADIVYKFAGFTINKSQQILIKDRIKNVINTKAYYLLLTFLDNHGKILSKDELINAVWPGQIVTDTALTKQIVRLRKVIGDSDLNNPMIETHRGVGYRFVTPVEIHQITEDDAIINIDNVGKSAEANKFSKIKWYFAVFALVLITSFYFFNLSIHSSDKKLEIQTLQAGVGLAIIPNNTNQDWLNKGGLNYLSQMLDRNKYIYTIKPRPEWYKGIEAEKLGVEISSHEKIEYAFLVSIDESDNQLNANVKLRTSEKVIASDELNAENINELLVKVNNWVGKILLADKKINEFYLDKQISYDNYAMESYLQGVFQQEFNNYQKASEFYQAAVNKDIDFIQAWIQLADTSYRLGNTTKANAIIENVLNKYEKKLTPKQFIKLYYIIGYSHYFAGDREKAKYYLSQSAHYISETNNPLTKLAGYDTLGGLAFLQQDWKLAEEYTLKRIALARDFYPFPDFMAAMNLLMAEISGSQARLDDAKTYLNQSMNYYDKIDDPAGMVRAMVSMSEINFLQNDYSEGIALFNKAQPYLKKIKSPDIAFKFMDKSCQILNLRGLFDQCDELLTKMEKIAEQSQNVFYWVMIESLKVRSNYIQGQFQQANKHVEKMENLFEKNTNLTPYKNLYALHDLRIFPRLDRSNAEQDLKKYNSYIDDYPELEKTNSAELNHALAHIHLKSGHDKEAIKLLEKAELIKRKDQDISTANYIGFEILEILLKNPQLDYKTTLNRIASYTQYDYLFFKLKAQFLAREGNYFDAAIIMSENKQKANQLWSSSDQLLLEEFQLKSKN